MNIKEKLLEIQLDMLNDKIDVFQEMISQMSLDAQNDAKSSAGDKHETALSMMHLEQEKLSNKVTDALRAKKLIQRINPLLQSEQIGMGSFVRINAIHLFFSAALPKVTVEGISVLSISMDAPLARALQGKKLGDTIVFNGSEFTVQRLE